MLSRYADTMNDVLLFWRRSIKCDLPGLPSQRVACTGTARLEIPRVRVDQAWSTRGRGRVQRSYPHRREAYINGVAGRGHSVVSDSNPG